MIDIKILDYGLGNIRSLYNALEKIDQKVSFLNNDNDNFDPKIKDLFDKASKNSQTNLAIKEFSELVEELTTLPIQNSKIRFKTLNHILQDTKYDKHNLVVKLKESGELLEIIKNAI